MIKGYIIPVMEDTGETQNVLTLLLLLVEFTQRYELYIANRLIELEAE